MALNAISGSGLGLGSIQGQIQGGNTEVVLQAGAALMLPSGDYWITPGPYTFIQVRDPLTGVFRNIAQTPNTPQLLHADGFNQRLVNLTGCAIGAYVTNVGSGYTSAPTIAVSAGSSTWTPIWTGIGLTTAAAHIVNSTVTVSAAGTGYTYPPNVIFPAPPAGGVAATGYCTLSGSTVSSVTMVDQGAGYLTAPVPIFLNDPRDTTGSGAAATTTLTGSGTLGAILRGNHGTPLTSVPTLTISGGGGASGAATAVMCFAATGLTVTTGGAVYGNAQPFLATIAGGTVGGAAGATVNPAVSTGLLTPRVGIMTGTSTAGGAVTATGLVINDGGLFSAVPTAFFTASGTAALPTTTAIATVTVGGATDRSIVVPV